jgi:outer membrane protein
MKLAYLSFRPGRVLFFLSTLLVLASSLLAQSLSMKHAIELALTHSTTSAASDADEQRAFASYLEARNQYLPQLVVGSGLGKTWGYPLSLEGSAPSIVNLTAQSALINPALREFVRAAKTEYQASTLQAKEQRNLVMQDTVLSYVELNRWEVLMNHLREDNISALKAEQIVARRIQEGVDNALAGNQARLTTARVHLRIIQAEGSMDLLREKLSHLTGLPAGSITTETESIPALPEIKQEDVQHEDDLIAKTLDLNPGVQAANTRFLALMQKAKGEHRALWPSIDFAGQYALLATFNNYENYFVPGSFQQHNATVGITMRFPFLNPSQHAHAQAADAEALHAKKEAESTRNQASEEVLRLRRSVEQTEAARQVADLEYQIAESGLRAAQIRMDSGNATIHEAEDARVQVTDRFNSLQDANFELERARIGLLRASGDLASWAGIDSQVLEQTRR